MQKEKLAIDLDGCLANFNEAYARMFKQRGFDMPAFDGAVEYPRTWNYPEDNYNVPKAVVSEVWREIRNSRTFWRDLAPEPTTPWDSDVWSLLNWLQVTGHEVYFFTTRPGINAHMQSRSWLEGMGIIHPQVLIVPGSKGTLAKELGITMAVDDKPENIEDFGRFRDEMAVYHVLRPYNRHVDVPGTFEVNDTLEALRHFIERKGLAHEGLRRAA